MKINTTFLKLSIDILSEYPQYIYTTAQKFGDSNIIYLFIYLLNINSWIIQGCIQQMLQNISVLNKWKTNVVNIYNILIFLIK